MQNSQISSKRRSQRRERERRKADYRDRENNVPYYASRYSLIWATPTRSEYNTAFPLDPTVVPDRVVRLPTTQYVYYRESDSVGAVHPDRFTQPPSADRIDLLPSHYRFVNIPWRYSVGEWNRRSVPQERTSARFGLDHTRKPTIIRSNRLATEDNS